MTYAFIKAGNPGVQIVIVLPRRVSAGKISTL
jgi:hypothetical protein